MLWVYWETLLQKEEEKENIKETKEEEEEKKKGKMEDANIKHFLPHTPCIQKYMYTSHTNMHTHTHTHMHTNMLVNQN